MREDAFFEWLQPLVWKLKRQHRLVIHACMCWDCLVFFLADVLYLTDGENIAISLTWGHIVNLWFGAELKVAKLGGTNFCWWPMRVNWQLVAQSAVLTHIHYERLECLKFECLLFVSKFNNCGFNCDTRMHWHTLQGDVGVFYGNFAIVQRNWK